MLINCNNKGCYKESEALLDRATQNVICQECHKTVTNISPFLKTTMQSVGQVVRENKMVPYGSTCKSCKKTTAPVSKGGKYYCQHCQAEIKFNPVYENFLKIKNQ